MIIEYKNAYQDSSISMCREQNDNRHLGCCLLIIGGLATTIGSFHFKGTTHFFDFKTLDLFVIGLTLDVIALYLCCIGNTRESSGYTSIRSATAIV